MLDLLPQLLLTGATIGSIYALVALGFVLIYAVTGILNFAQGEFCMLGALFCATMLAWHAPLALAALSAVAGVCVLGAATEQGLTVKDAGAAGAGPKEMPPPDPWTFTRSGMSLSARGLPRPVTRS